jgi:hypothetical protein
MRVILVILASVLWSAGGVATAEPCGWYVVFVCSREAREAKAWSDGHEAIESFVLKTDARHPNFAPGWFCAVSGPVDRAAAVARAAEVRDWGAAPSAYAKNSCR